MRLRFTITGADPLSRKLQTASTNGPQAMGQALVETAEQVMTVSKTDYVPVDTGALRASGHVQPAVWQGAKVEVEFGFGGPAAPYALYVHENLTAHHPVGQAKYLESPLLAAVQGMPGVMARRVSDAIRQSFQRLGRVERGIRRAQAREVA